MLHGKHLSHRCRSIVHKCATASTQTCQVYYTSFLQFEVMVTAGANQAFTNVVLTLLDSQDKVVLFKPYYFNHLMAVQMTGGADNVVYGRYSKMLHIAFLLAKLCFCHECHQHAQ